MTNRVRTLLSITAASAALLTLTHASGAVAQQITPPPPETVNPAADRAIDADEVAEVVVTGYRAQNTQAIIAKRETEQIAEFLSIDEIGQLPDYNVADSFRRLPGVQTVFDEDEGRYVAIRGLNPNFTFGSLDGGTLATAERQNRQLNMEAVPTTAISRLEVFKSRTPDLEANAIGGSVNLVTRSPFDEDGLYAVGAVFAGFSDSRDIPGEGFNRDQDDQANYRADGTVSYVFGDRDQFGVLATAAYSRKSRDQERQLPQPYAATPGTFGVPVSRGFRTSSYPNTVERYGGTVKLGWRPTEAFRTNAALTYYIQVDNELRFNQELTLPALPAAPGATYTQRPDGALNVASGTGYVLFNDFPLEKPLTAGQLDFEWEPGERQRLTGRASYSEAQFLEPSNETRFSVPNSTTNAGVYELRGDIPVYTLTNPAATYLNPASYAFTSYNPYQDDSDDFIREAQLDYGFNTDRGADGFGFGAGVKWRENERDFDTGQTFFGPAAGNTLTLAQVLGQTGYRSPYGVSDQLILDFEAFQSFFRANPALFTLNAAGTAASQSVRDYVVEETVSAGYGLVRYGSDRLTVIGGLRYENTETQVDGLRVQGTTLTPLSRASEYDDVLPSINVIYDVGERLKLRAAYYRALGRPNPSELGTNETINQATGTVSRGNPDLIAREADNFDLAIEYYLPGNQGLLSAGVFYKEIENDIFSILAGSTTIGGVTYQVTQPINLSSSKISGLELQYVQNRLEFLPGRLANLGLSANLTLLDGESELPGGITFDRLPGQPDMLGNFAVFYEEGPLQARATYAYYGEYFTAISPTDFADNRYDRPYNQLDFQARYAFDRFELIGEVRNVTDENRINYQTGNLARDLNFFGRQFWLGVAFKPFRR